MVAASSAAAVTPATASTVAPTPLLIPPPRWWPRRGGRVVGQSSGIPGRIGTPRRESAVMAPRKRTLKLRPKKPARIRKRKKKRSARSHHHPELAGLASIALGVFLAGVLWFGLSGGPVGHASTAALGWAAYVLPLALVPLGALVVTRSALVDVRPFRLGLSVTSIGLMLTLGRAHGGLFGKGLERVV